MFHAANNGLLPQQSNPTNHDTESSWLSNQSATDSSSESSSPLQLSLQNDFWDGVKNVYKKVPEDVSHDRLTDHLQAYAHAALNVAEERTQIGNKLLVEFAKSGKRSLAIELKTDIDQLAAAYHDLLAPNTPGPPHNAFSFAPTTSLAAPSKRKTGGSLSPEKRQQLIDAIIDNPTATPRQIAKIVDVHYVTVWYHQKALAAKADFQQPAADRGGGAGDEGPSTDNDQKQRRRISGPTLGLRRAL
jgi:hypothetical protein